MHVVLTGFADCHTNVGKFLCPNRVNLVLWMPLVIKKGPFFYFLDDLAP